MNNLNDLCERRLVTSKSLSWQCLSDQLFVNVKVIANHSSCYCSWPIKCKYGENSASFQSARSARVWEKARIARDSYLWGNFNSCFWEKMSHFSFETEVNNLLRLDAPMSRGPAPRWQKKSTERRRSSSAPSTPLRNSFRLNSSKTPSKTPKSLKKTPGKAKTPSEDRFIPNRSAMNFEANYYKMVSADRENEENECESPSKVEFKKNMAENLGGNEANTRILAFKNKAPTPREGTFKWEYLKWDRVLNKLIWLMHMQARGSYCKLTRLAYCSF